MKSVLEFCIFMVALMLAVVALFLLATSLGFGDSIWKPLAALGLAAGIMGLMGLQKTGNELERRRDDQLLGRNSLM